MQLPAVRYTAVPSQVQITFEDVINQESTFYQINYLYT
jgi:hypothetical protein